MRLGDGGREPRSDRSPGERARHKKGRRRATHLGRDLSRPGLHRRVEDRVAAADQDAREKDGDDVLVDGGGQVARDRHRAGARGAMRLTTRVPARTAPP